MESVSVSCNNCGAALNVINKTKFVTCNYCKSQLKVQSSGETFYTEILEEIKDVADDVETIKLQNRLERLDREWGMNSKRFMIRDKNGHERLPPSKTAAMVGVCFIVGFVIFWIIVASVIATVFAKNVPFGGFAFIMPFLGVGMLAFIVFGSKTGRDKLRHYEMARAEYEKKRKWLVDNLNNR